MTPKVRLIIAKTRELLDATPAPTLTAIYTTMIREGIKALETSPEGGWLEKRLPFFRALLEHSTNLSTEESAKEFCNYIEGIINSGDERLILEQCKYAAQAIAEIESKGGSVS